MEPQSYYKIVQAYDDGYRIETPLGLPNRPDGYSTDFLSGKMVVVPTPEIFDFGVDCLPNESPRHFVDGTEALAVSAKFVDALRQAGVDNFEIWPAVLHEINGTREWKDFFAFNEIGLLNAVSMKDSRGDVLLGGNDDNIPPVVGFHKLVFDSKKTRGRKMFRIPQFPPDLYISWKVMDFLRRNSPSEGWGVTVRKVEVV